MARACMRPAMGVLAVVVAGAAASASAQGIDPGRYALANHPDGNAANPLYGLRLDELADVTNGHDIFTFDFDHDLSSMEMTFDGAKIVITGRSWGGRDVGSSYADDEYLGVYSISFTYDAYVGYASGDDDVLVDHASMHENSGSITLPTGEVISLWDKSNGNFAFRFGDKHNDQGHRGHDGLSGWGWLNHGDSGEHVAASDWLFTATQMVPTPGTGALAALGGLLAMGRRRS